MAIEIKDKHQTSAGEFFSVVIDGTTIKDCKLMDGSKGEFVAGPARLGKDKDGNGNGGRRCTFPTTTSAISRRHCAGTKYQRCLTMEIAYHFNHRRPN